MIWQAINDRLDDFFLWLRRGRIRMFVFFLFAGLAISSGLDAIGVDEFAHKISCQVTDAIGLTGQPKTLPPPDADIDTLVDYYADDPCDEPSPPPTREEINALLELYRDDPSSSAPTAQLQPLALQ